MGKKFKADGKQVCVLRSNPVRPDSRVEKEAWTLKRAGYDVRIVAWDRDTDAYETEATIEVANEIIPITRFGHRATFGEGMKNIKAYLSFQFHMRKWLKKNDFDIVHACDFDTAFFSQDIVRRKKKKFVFDIFDFLCGEPKNFFQRIIKKAQLRIINKADATIICTEERKKQIKGSNPKRLAVIHNTPSGEQVGKEVFSLPETHKVRVVYVGILQDYRLLKEITEAIAESDIAELHIAGFGKYDTFFSQMSEQYENISFYGRMTYDRALALESECDIMLAIYDPTIENHRFAAPNKFYESLMLGKPVLMVKNTGMSQIVEENDIGVLIDYSKEGFSRGMSELIKKKHEWPSMAIKMKNLYENQYCWEEMEKRLIELYADLDDEKDIDCKQ